MMKNKKGIELSINFIVILILSIVIFGFGIAFLRDMMTEVDKLKDITDKDFQANIENLLCDSSERICIGINRREIKRNKVGFFTLGIRNTYPETRDFSITIEQDEDFGDAELGVLVSGQGKITLNPNEHEQVGIAVGVPSRAEKTTYVLNVYVCIDEDCEKDSENRYGTTKKIYVVVN